MQHALTEHWRSQTVRNELSMIRSVVVTVVDPDLLEITQEGGPYRPGQPLGEEKGLLEHVLYFKGVAMSLMSRDVVARYGSSVKVISLQLPLQTQLLESVGGQAQDQVILALFTDSLQFSDKGPVGRHRVRLL